MFSHAHDTLEKLEGLYVEPDLKHQHTLAYDGFEDDWTPIRKSLGRAISSPCFDGMLCLLILGNMVLLVLETDQRAANGEAEEWVQVVNYILIAVYTVEMSIRIYVYRKVFFTIGFNWADLIIVATDIIIETLSLLLGDDDIPSVVCLRMLRILRLGRSHKALQLFPELRVMIVGLFGAARAIFWGMILLLLALITWAILAVQIIHPLNKKITASGEYERLYCERCPRAFESVPAAILTFTQHIIAGDSWGNVSVTIIEHYPATYPFFFLVLVTMGMAILNTILAVVIDSAAAARKETDHQLVQMRDLEFRKASDSLLLVCKELDADNSGSLTLEELCGGYQSNQDFADAMAVLDIKEDDMKTVFSMMDVDNSGDVGYEEFTKEIYKIKMSDSHTLLVFIKHYVVQIRQKLYDDMARLLRLWDPDGIRSKGPPEVGEACQRQQQDPSAMKDSTQRDNAVVSPSAKGIDDNVILLDSIAKAAERIEKHLVNMGSLYSLRRPSDLNSKAEEDLGFEFESGRKPPNFPEPRLQVRV